MSKYIRFERTKFDAKGRNGYIGTTGINVVDLGEELFLEPITTRGVNSEACRIVLPKSTHHRADRGTRGLCPRFAPQPAPEGVRRAGPRPPLHSDSQRNGSGALKFHRS